MKCNKCGFENDADAEYCENCGEVLARICANCHAPLKPKARFCKVCGTSISAQRAAIDETGNQAWVSRGDTAQMRKTPEKPSTRIEGERKPVTILFTDIVGSTSLAEKLDPEEWKEIINGAHQRVNQAVTCYGGTIAQFLGDGVLAFFGAPITHEDDPVRAVHAALAIQKSISQYAVELKGCVEGFQMRIGLNNGLVVVGNVGSDTHLEYLAVGDAVNLAARLQSAAQPSGILISENLARFVNATFDLESQGEITLKGKSKPVAVFTVIKRKDTPESARGFEELYSPLVGRENEINLLRAALDDLSRGHGKIVTIFGEAGIGKSRLVEELHKYASHSSPGVHWLEGRALSYGQTLSFWIINQLIYSDLQLSDGDPEVRVRTALKRRVNELFAEKAGEVLPYLGQLLGISLDSAQSEQVQQLEGETLKYQTLLSISRYFQKMAEAQPTVLVLDDLHWADPSSLEALKQLLSITDHTPLMLVLLSRLEREHDSWQIKLKAETDFSHRYTELQLKPLSKTEQNLLVNNLLAVADLPESTRQLILDRTEGNPFYLEEIIRSLIDQGVIVRAGDNWRATHEITEIALPDTLQGVLLARIDRLQEDVRRTLQLASVIGKSFLFRLLEAIAEAEQQLEGHLAQLQRVDLVREKSCLPELEYMFKHSLTQEAAYDSLLLEQRRDFHHRVGKALETLFAERKDKYLGLLAHHFEKAGENDVAVDYLIQAGDRARLSDEHIEAVDYYIRAVRLLKDSGEKERAARVWLKLGLVYSANFQFEKAHQANETAFQMQRVLEKKDAHIADREGHTLRSIVRFQQITLDPGKVVWSQDCVIVENLFSGLTRLDQELNVLPEVARSWQVLDDGRRYIFHLRDDWPWTDGTMVTAGDFEWAWKRNLDPALRSEFARFLFDVVGAKDYYEQKNTDPENVGVKALDAHTLEIRLVEPVAYFPFIVTMPVTYPLPGRVIASIGEDWWKPEHILSNGPGRLVEYDADQGGVLERNPLYPGLINGNIQRKEWKLITDADAIVKAYQEDRTDIAFISIKSEIPDSVPQEEIYEVTELAVYFIVFNPTKSPFDDLRVRQAIAHTFDRKKMWDEFDVPVSHGGLIPPGMPGHSPELGYPFDLNKARELLSEAGYPGGRGFPAVKGYCPLGRVDIFNAMTAQWKSELGIDITFESIGQRELIEWEGKVSISSLLPQAWVADYPDPDDFLHRSMAITTLRSYGWHDTAFDRLVSEAARTTDRTKRMAMYRQADRILNNDQCLLVNLCYGTKFAVFMVKPRVKDFSMSALGKMDFLNVIVEDH